jgi:hypothetical protein
MAKPGLVDGSGGGVLDSLRSASYLNPAVRRPARDAYVADATKDLQKRLSRPVRQLADRYACEAQLLEAQVLRSGEPGRIRIGISNHVVRSVSASAVFADSEHVRHT